MPNRNSQADQELIKAILQDNSPVMTKYYDQFWDGFLKMIIACKSDKRDGEHDKDAQEVYQGAWVKLIKQVQNRQFNGESSVKTYFYRISFNSWITFLRNKNKDVDKLQPLTDLITKSYPDGENEDEEYEQFLAKLPIVVKKLDEKCQQIFRLMSEGRSPQKAAEELGMTHGSFRVKLLKCRKVAKRLLGY